jgi:hypothetical protein
VWHVEPQMPGEIHSSGVVRVMVCAAGDSGCRSVALTLSASLGM